MRDFKLRTAALIVTTIWASTAWAQTINGTDRATADTLWKDYYLPALTPPNPGWSSKSQCDPGTTSAEYQAVALKRINYYRRMSGLLDAEIDPALVPAAQAGAFLVYTNNALNHTPPATWTCYSTTAAEGTARSNLGMSMSLSNAADGFIMETLSNNPSLGHRRYLLEPRMWKTALGHVPGELSGKRHWMSTYVLGATQRTDAQATLKHGFAGWPSPGYVPSQLVPQDWHFALPGVDFGKSKPTVTVNGAALTPSVAPMWSNTIIFTPTAVSVGQEYLVNITIPGTGSTPTAAPITVNYQAHVQNTGWMAEGADGAVVGTTGKALRVEALKIRLTQTSTACRVVYQAHVQDIGWQAEVSDGAVAGTIGQSKRVEAVKLRLANCDPSYHIHYQAHVQDIGWQAEVSDGAQAGTTGQAKRIEAIKIRVAASSSSSSSAKQYTYKVIPYSATAPPPDFTTWTLTNAAGFPLRAQFDTTPPVNGITYSLISGPGDTDNAKFVMDTTVSFKGLTNQTAVAAPGVYSIRVRATNAGGTLEKTLRVP